jgi:hypothetical protein
MKTTLEVEAMVSVPEHDEAHGWVNARYGVGDDVVLYLRVDRTNDPEAPADAVVVITGRESLVMLRALIDSALHEDARKDTNLTESA